MSAVHFEKLMQAKWEELVNCEGRSYTSGQLECIRMAVTACLEKYIPMVCEHPIKESRVEDYCTGLGRCLGYHWSRANQDTTDLDHVISQLEQEIGFPDGRWLGGNPIRDVVLATAVVQRDPHATELFVNEYQPLIKSVVFKTWSSQIVRDFDDWWNEFLYELVGYSDKPPLLLSFAGKSGLALWLRTTTWRRAKETLNKSKKSKEKATDPDQMKEVPGRDDGEADPELRERLKELLRQGLKKLETEDLLLLKFVYVDGLSQREAAMIVNLHEGHASRRIKSAVHELETFVTTSPAGALLAEELEKHKLDFAESLRSVLEERIDIDESQTG